jgi:hypothetical protein
MRNNDTIESRMLALERVENLMLIAVLGQEPYRSQAQLELHRRRLVSDFDHLQDSIQTNLGVAC